MLVYVASNSVEDRLVQHARQWPGTNGYVHLLSGKSMRARRPRFFFRDGGTMPEVVELDLVIPPELGPTDQVRAEVRAGVEAVERRVMGERAKTGARVLGVKKVREQSWRASPSSVEPGRNPRPRFAGTTENRIRALLEYKAFLAAYREARGSWLAGKAIAFPRGTYWLARYAPITVLGSGSAAVPLMPS